MTRKQLLMRSCIAAIMLSLLAACTIQPPAAAPTAAEVPPTAAASTAVPAEEATPAATTAPAVAATPLVFKGHERDIWDVAISPDGTLLATSSSDGTARLWDLATGEQIQVFAPQSGALGMVDFSRDGKHLLISGEDGWVHLWDVASGKDIQDFADKGGDAVFSPDGTRVASTGGPDGTAQIWDVTTGEPLHMLSGHTEFIPRIAYSPDGKYVLTGSVDRTARIWDAATGSEMHIFDAGDAVSAVAFSADSQYAATGSDDFIARVWDVDTGDLVREFAGHEGYINGISFSPDGRYLLTGSRDTTARLWDIASGELVHAFKGATGDVQGVVFSPDGRLVAGASNDGIAYVWNLQAALADAGTSAPGTMTLRLAVPDGSGVQGIPYMPYVFAFIDEVKNRSDGRIIIEPLWEAGNVTEAGFETGLIQLVKEGRAELGIASTRAFDTVGITSFQPLQAPFLVDNDALAEAVATSDIATRMMADLAGNGLAGFALWPEDLRHPFSLVPDQPWLVPEDMAGQTIRSSPSEMSYRLIEALGATPTTDDGYQGAESGLRQGFSLNGPATATGNVTFFAKFQSLFANDAALAQLSDADRALLREAAVAVQAQALSEHPRDVDAAQAWCAEGGSIALADDEQIEAFVAAAQPLYDLLEQNPQHAELVAALRELKASTPPSPGADACAPGN